MTSAYRYESMVGSALRALKFQGARGVLDALPMRMTFDESVDLWVPVPIHRSRSRLRGFNQSTLIFRPWVVQNGGLWLDAVERCVATPSLYALPSRVREQVVANAFRIPNDLRPQVAGRNVCVVDDILTTGATMGSVAKTLLNAGAASVTGLCLSYTIEENL